MLVGLCSSGLFAEEVRRASSNDTFRFGTSPTFQVLLQKAAFGPEQLCPNDTLSYLIALTNQSSQGSGDLAVTLADPIPAGTTYIEGSASNGAVFNTGQNSVTWTGFLGGSFPLSQTISFRVRINQDVLDGTVITNLVSARIFLPNQTFFDRQAVLRLNCAPPAGPVTWTGAGVGNDFSNPNNWNPRGVPGPDHDAVIPTNSGIITVSQSHEVRSLDLGTNSTLRIQDGSLILRQGSTVNGLLVNGFVESTRQVSDVQGIVSGELTIQGDVSGTGRIRNSG